jgi:Homeodomain-like domain-containing protein
MPDVTAEEIQAFLAQGLSQRAIAKQLHIPRTTLQRLIARQNGLPARPATEVRSGNPTVILPREVAPERGVPADMLFDVMELVEWWRQRKRIAKEYEGTPRQTQRMTYHVEPRFIELIKEFAKAEGVSVTDVVNRAFRQFFEGR